MRWRWLLHSLLRVALTPHERGFFSVFLVAFVGDSFPLFSIAAAAAAIVVVVVVVFVVVVVDLVLVTKMMFRFVAVIILSLLLYFVCRCIMGACRSSRPDNRYESFMRCCSNHLFITIDFDPPTTIGVLLAPPRSDNVIFAPCFAFWE